jgi:hypothetical protein
MKTIQPKTDAPAFQGDVAFLRVRAVPKDAVEVERAGGALVVTHSETGHHHVVVDQGVQMFAGAGGDGMVSYLKIPAGGYADVVHRRPWDTHETLRLLADEGGETVYQVRRQREWAPEGWRRVED